jgi:hypothetical protein
MGKNFWWEGARVILGTVCNKPMTRGYFITRETIDPITQLPDIYLTKTDANGDEEWTKTIDNHGGEDRACCGQPPDDEGYIITYTPVIT